MVKLCQVHSGPATFTTAVTNKKKETYHSDEATGMICSTESQWNEAAQPFVHTGAVCLLVVLNLFCALVIRIFLGDCDTTDGDYSGGSTRMLPLAGAATALGLS